MADIPPSTDRIDDAAFRAATVGHGWRITYTGPQAHYRSASFGDSITFAARIGEAAAATGISPDVDVRPNGVTVRLWSPGSRDDLAGMPKAIVGFAIRVTSDAEASGLETDPSGVQTVQLAVMHHPDVDVRPFWAAALGYEPRGDSFAVDRYRRGPQLWFDPFDPDRPGRGRTHIDVAVPADEAAARVAAAVAAGGRIVDDSNAPDWWVLASPDNHGVDIVAWTDS